MRRVELSEVSKAFGRTRALDRVTGSWEEGSLVALVGANGGGKSTLLRLVSGVLTPDSGRIVGLDAFRAASMPDRIAFSSGWTAWDWLSLVASWKQAPRGRVAEVLDEVGLGASAHQRVATFSQGMVRRLLWAQTRLTPIDLLFLDEPEGGLDPQWAVRLEDELAAHRRAGTTVVFSTHWLDLAVDQAHRLWVFSGGRLVADEGTEAWRALDAGARRRRLVSLIDPGAP